MRLVRYSLGTGVVLVSIVAACGDGGDGSKSATPTSDDASAGDGGRRSPVDEGGVDASPASCDALGKACVDVGSSRRLSVAFDDGAHPVVAYGTSDGIRVRRWNDAEWKALGAAIPNRLLDGGFQLHALGTRLFLVSQEAKVEQNIHVQEYDGTEWNDVAGSPFTVSDGPKGARPPEFHSSSGDGKIHIFSGGTPSQVKRFDGVSFVDEAPPQGISSSVISPLIDVTPGGALAVLYSFWGSQGIPSNSAYLARNEAGTTNWTRVNSALVFDSEYGVAFSNTTSGAVVAIAVAQAWLIAMRGDESSWTPLGADDGTVDSPERVGNPAAVEDDTGQPVLVYPVYDDTTNLVVRAKRWDGKTWNSVGDSARALAPSFEPATAAAASRGKTIAAVASRAAPAFEYIGYDELTLP